MAKNFETQGKPSDLKDLARHFSRWGWTGFWMQLGLLLIPILLLIYVLFIGGDDSAQRRGINLSNYLSYGSLLVMLFTTFWFYQYTRLSRQMEDPDLCPPLSSILRTLWIGVGAGGLGIFFSMILMMSAVLRLLFILLATPQTGVPMAAPGGDHSMTLSAIDAVSLTALLFNLTAELIVLAFSLWLLFRVTRPSDEITDAVASD